MGNIWRLFWESMSLGWEVGGNIFFFVDSALLVVAVALRLLRRETEWMESMKERLLVVALATGIVLFFGITCIFGPILRAQKAIDERDEAIQTSARLRREILKRDKSEKEFRDKVVLGVGSATMVPRVEGLTWSQKQVASNDDAFPYALEITIQVQAEVSPFGVAVYCDVPIKGYGRLPNSPGVMANVRFGPMVDAPDTSFGYTFSYPAMSPQRPLILVVQSKQPIRLLKVVRF